MPPENYPTKADFQAVVDAIHRLDVKVERYIAIGGTRQDDVERRLDLLERVAAPRTVPQQLTAQQRASLWLIGLILTPILLQKFLIAAAFKA